MAQSAKGAGNILGPLFIVSALVVVALAVTFALSDEEIPDDATIIAEDEVEARPAGAGTVPEGNADPEMEGITDELDEVDPAAPGVDTVPAAEMDMDDPAVDSTSTDQDADSGAEGQEAEMTEAKDPSDAGEIIVDDAAGDGVPGDEVEDSSAEGVPAGRDAEVELSPDADQSVVRDTDDGGTAFIPTPSGPAGRDGENIAD